MATGVCKSRASVVVCWSEGRRQASVPTSSVGILWGLLPVLEPLLVCRLLRRGLCTVGAAEFLSRFEDRSRQAERPERYTRLGCVVLVAVYLQREWSFAEVDLPCIHHAIGVAAVGVSNRNCDATLR